MIVKLLRAGEKPSISDAVNRRIVKVLRDVLGDLAPGPDSIAFDERPVRSLIEAVLAADTAWACPDCPPAASGIPGPSFSFAELTATETAGVVTWSFTGSYDFVTSEYNALNLQTIQVEIGCITQFNPPIIEWTGQTGLVTLEFGRSTFGNTYTPVDDNYICFRSRWLDALSQPYGDWVVSGSIPVLHV